MAAVSIFLQGKPRSYMTKNSEGILFIILKKVFFFYFATDCTGPKDCFGQQLIYDLSINFASTLSLK